MIDDAFIVTICLFAVFVMVILCIPFIYRVIEGPTVFDRIAGLNGIGTMGPVMLVLIGVIYQRTDMLIDLALGIFMLNLFLTLMVGKYIKARIQMKDADEA